MTSLFLRAVANLRSAAQSAAAQAAQPAPVPAAPVVWDKRNEEELKRIIPLSIIELKDGSFAATPAKRCVQRDGPTGLKLFASTEGRLDGGSSAVDIANVKRIAMGVLTDPAVGGLSGTEAGSLRWDALAASDMMLMASRLEPIARIIFVDALGCSLPSTSAGRLDDGFGLGEFVEITSRNIVQATDFN